MKKLSCALLVFSVSLLGCGGGHDGPVERSWGEMKGLDEIVGNINDISYSSGRTQEPRSNALGQPVSMTDFEGSFVWAEYAAPWCGVCASQAPETKAVKAELGSSIAFLTVMTGQSTNYNDHATVNTAKAWASSHGSDPSRVVAAELWFKTIPEHRFYSPQGHTLFVHVGFLSSAQIRDVIFYYKTGYEQWVASGELAEWMSD